MTDEIFSKGPERLTNPELTARVITSLGRDPRIPAPAEIAVSAYGGIVTLRGTVENFPQRRAAVQDARRIDGVREVDDQLKVNPPGAARHGDDAIRGAALQALIWDVEVPAEWIDVEVHDGRVTLKGDVEHQYERDAAFDDVARLHGVVDITNEITVNGR
jgi:osmotically-inducible protein OsmY